MKELKFTISKDGMLLAVGTMPWPFRFKHLTVFGNVIELQEAKTVSTVTFDDLYVGDFEWKYYNEWKESRK